MISASQLQGTTAGGTLNIAASAVNDLLRLSRPEAGLSVDFEPQNQALIRYGVFHARITLPRTIDLRTQSRITVTLASTVIAWGLKAMLTQPFLSVAGRDVTVDLDAVPALQPWREWLRGFTAIEVATSKTTLAVVFTFQVPE